MSQNKSMRRILLLLIILALIAGAYGFFQFNKGPVNLASKRAEVSITSVDLFNAFQKDEKAFNQAYLNKVVEVKGKVTSVKEKEGITTIALASEDMMFGVNCQMAGTAQGLEKVKKGDTVSIKGQCDGALMDVVLTKCVLIKS